MSLRGTHNFPQSTKIKGMNYDNAGTEYAMLGLRKNFRNIEFIVKDLSAVSTAGAATAYIWRLQINPTLSAPLSYSAIANTGLDSAIATTQTVTSQGHIISSGVASARATSLIGDISKGLRIGQTIAGTSDELILSIEPLSNNQDVAASFSGIVI